LHYLSDLLSIESGYLANVSIAETIFASKGTPPQFIEHLSLGSFPIISVSSLGIFFSGQLLRKIRGQAPM
jgi:hypothetical protein